jgi:magnesium chelatase family protein
LSIAIGILAASDQILADEIQNYIIMGELSLDGSLQPIKGVPIAIRLGKKALKELFYLSRMQGKQLLLMTLMYTE